MIADPRRAGFFETRMGSLDGRIHVLHTARIGAGASLQSRQPAIRRGRHSARIGRLAGLSSHPGSGHLVRMALRGEGHEGRGRLLATARIHRLEHVGSCNAQARRRTAQAAPDGRGEPISPCPLRFQKTAALRSTRDRTGPWRSRREFPRPVPAEPLGGIKRMK